MDFKNYLKKHKRILKLPLFLNKNKKLIKTRKILSKLLCNKSIHAKKTWRHRNVTIRDKQKNTEVQCQQLCRDIHVNFGTVTSPNNMSCKTFCFGKKC